MWRFNTHFIIRTNYYLLQLLLLLELFFYFYKYNLNKYILNIIHNKGKAEAITPVSHDPSEILLICWSGAQDTFLIIIIQVYKQLGC